MFRRPLHPYTRALVSAMPVPDPEREQARETVPLEGDIPSPAAPPPGCRFHTRCPFADARCRTEEPAWRKVAGPEADDDRWVACHHAEALEGSRADATVVS